MTATRVAAYRLDGGVVGEFIGWGSLIESHLAVLHPPELEQQDPVRFVRASRPTGHPVPADVRCRITNGRFRHTRDGSLVTMITSSGGHTVVLQSISFEVASTAPTSPVAWSVLPSTELAVTELVDFLTEAAADDPTSPPTTPPGRPPHQAADEPPLPGLRPPWCSIWPTAFGCR